MLLNIIIVVILRLYEIRASAQIPLEATQKADDLSIGLTRNMTIMQWRRNITGFKLGGAKP